MALKMTYDPNKLLNDALRIEKAIISRMQFIGEKFVSDARSQPQPSSDWKKGQIGPKEHFYKDRTANLRSSLGYFILKDNTVIGGNVDGTAKGKEEAKAILMDIPTRSGIRLVGVAGMNYASAVESLGYNVISTQSIVAVDDLHKQMLALAKKTGKKTDLLDDLTIH